MMEMVAGSDRDLLVAYGAHGDAAAFEALVNRHAGWLFAAAYRQLKDVGRAEDAVQVVFVLLAQRAERMGRHERLSGWLFRALRYTVRNSQRAEKARVRRERVVAKGEAVRAGTDIGELAELVDGAVARLSEGDRAAILLRFYEGVSFEDVAAGLHTTESGARKRVERALVKLRRLIGVGPGALDGRMMAALVGQGGSRVPPGLGVSVTKMALAAKGGAAASGSVVAAAKGTAILMAMTKLHVALVVAVAALAVGVPATIWTARRMSGPIAPAAEVPEASPAAQEVPAADFASVYGLAPGEMFKRIAEPPVEVRESAIMDKFQVGLPRGAWLFLTWGDDGAIGYSYRFGGNRRYPLSEILSRPLGLEEAEMEGDLLTMEVNGDFVYRQGGSPEQFCTAMESFLKREFGVEARVEVRNVPRQVVVARGQWRFTPPADAPVAHSPTYPDGTIMPSILIYGDRALDGALTQSGSGSGDGRLLAWTIGWWMREQVFMECQGVPDVFGYRTFAARRGEDPIVDHDKAAVLKHLAEQTGLTWTEETRVVRRLIVEKR